MSISWYLWASTKQSQMSISVFLFASHSRFTTNYCQTNGYFDLYCHECKNHSVFARENAIISLHLKQTLVRRVGLWVSCLFTWQCKPIDFVLFCHLSVHEIDIGQFEVKKKNTRKKNRRKSLLLSIFCSHSYCLTCDSTDCVIWFLWNML